MNTAMMGKKAWQDIIRGMCARCHCGAEKCHGYLGGHAKSFRDAMNEWRDPDGWTWKVRLPCYRTCCVMLLQVASVHTCHCVVMPICQPRCLFVKDVYLCVTLLFAINRWTPIWTHLTQTMRLMPLPEKPGAWLALQLLRLKCQKAPILVLMGMQRVSSSFIVVLMQVLRHRSCHFCAQYCTKY